MKTQFEIWWETEGDKSFKPVKELCRIAWENGAYCAKEDDDFNEPLGPACQLGDETCESCQ